MKSEFGAGQKLPVILVNKRGQGIRKFDRPLTRNEAIALVESTGIRVLGGARARVAEIGGLADFIDINVVDAFWLLIGDTDETQHDRGPGRSGESPSVASAKLRRRHS
jgi:hypothetical protein